MNDLQETQVPTQNYKGTWIPVELEKIGLSAIEQLLLAKIDSLDSGAPHYCFASNKFLSEQMDLSESRISFYITKFKRMGLLREVEFNGRRRRLESLKHEWYRIAYENSKKELCVTASRQTTCPQEGCLRENANHIEKKDSIEEELLPDYTKAKPEPPPIQAPSAVVVSFGSLSISDRQKTYIKKKYPQPEIEIAVKRVLLMQNRKSDEACLIYALQHPAEWTDTKSPDNIAVENDKYRRSILIYDEKILRNTKITVGYNYVEFVRGEIYDRKNVTDNDFIAYVQNKLKELKGG